MHYVCGDACVGEVMALRASWELVAGSLWLKRASMRLSLRVLTHVCFCPVGKLTRVGVPIPIHPRIDHQSNLLLYTEWIEYRSDEFGESGH